METLDIGIDGHHAAVFLNFLRGMETPFQEPGVLSGANFLNFLRGMETLRSDLADQKKRRFLNFLRGMETRRPFEPNPRQRVLPKLP